ncbi:MAG TPA: energy transducer TonB [Myxococcota bacterium]
MGWRSNHWSVPFLLIAIVWTPILIAYRSGWLSERLHALDAAAARDDPRGLSPTTNYALMYLSLESCDLGERLLDWVARGPTPPPAWTRSEVLACLERAGRADEARERLTALCADLPRSESDAVAAFRIDPVYPEDARLAGIEGHVEVSFDIVDGGRVRVREVGSSEPPGVFDEAAISAVEDWRYCPGSEHEGVRVRLAFELENAEAPAP